MNNLFDQSELPPGFILTNSEGLYRVTNNTVTSHEFQVQKSAIRYAWLMYSENRFRAGCIDGFNAAIECIENSDDKLMRDFHITRLESLRDKL